MKPCREVDTLLPPLGRPLGEGPATLATALRTALLTSRAPKGGCRASHLVGQCAHRHRPRTDRTPGALVLPPGLKLIAEYWLQTDNPRLISIVEADDIASVMAATSAWDDVFSFNVVPACTAEQGLEIAKKMLS